MSIHTRINLDRTCFTVFCDGEMHTYATEAEVRHHLTGTFGAPFAVVEFNAAEHRSDDVTAHFLTDEVEAEEDDARGIPSPAELLREHHGRVL